MNKREERIYIGTFNVRGNAIVVLDPYVCAMSIKMEQIPITNEKKLKLQNVVNGVYNAYLENNVLMLIHEEFEDHYATKAKEQVGYVSSSLSGATAAVDKCELYNSSNCFNAIELDAYYDVVEIEKRLSEMHYDEGEKKDLTALIESCMENEIHPTGREILKALGAAGSKYVWNGFRKFNEKSSHWSEDIKDSLENSYRGYYNIKGGISCKAEKGFLQCFCYRNLDRQIWGVEIELFPSDVSEKDVWKCVH